MCDRLLRVRELAEALSIPERSVYVLAERRSIPFLRAGRALRFDLAEVLEALHVEPTQGSDAP